MKLLINVLDERLVERIVYKVIPLKRTEDYSKSKIPAISNWTNNTYIDLDCRTNNYLKDSHNPVGYLWNKNYISIDIDDLELANTILKYLRFLNKVNFLYMKTKRGLHFVFNFDLDLNKFLWKSVSKVLSPLLFTFDVRGLGSSFSAIRLFNTDQREANFEGTEEDYNKFLNREGELLKFSEVASIFTFSHKMIHHSRIDNILKTFNWKKWTEMSYGQTHEYILKHRQALAKLEGAGVLAKIGGNIGAKFGQATYPFMSFIVQNNSEVWTEGQKVEWIQEHQKNDIVAEFKTFNREKENNEVLKTISGNQKLKEKNYDKSLEFYKAIESYEKVSSEGIPYTIHMVNFGTVAQILIDKYKLSFIHKPLKPRLDRYVWTVKDKQLINFDITENRDFFYELLDKTVLALMPWLQKTSLESYKNTLYSEILLNGTKVDLTLDKYNPDVGFTDSPNELYNIMYPFQRPKLTHYDDRNVFFRSYKEEIFWPIIKKMINRFGKNFVLGFFAQLFDIKSGLKVAIFLHGDSSEGKSTFCNTLAKLIGKDKVEGNLELSKGEFDAASLGGICNKLLTVSEEAAQDKMLHSGEMKKIIGGQKYRVRELYRQPYNAVYKGVLILTANDAPSFRANAQDGIHNRMSPIAWTKLFKDEEDLPEVMREDFVISNETHHNFIRFCLEAQQFIEYSNNGQKNYRKYLLVRESKLKLQEDSDPVLKFMITNFILKVMPDSKLKEMIKTNGLTEEVIVANNLQFDLPEDISIDEMFDSFGVFVLNQKIKDLGRTTFGKRIWGAVRNLQNLEPNTPWKAYYKARIINDKKERPWGFKLNKEYTKNKLESVKKDYTKIKGE